MDIFEFELRLRSYQWLNIRFDLWWDEATILEATKRTDKGVLTKVIQESSLEELREATKLTYTESKKNLIKNNESKVINGKPASEYIERLEYEFKVIFEMWYNTYFLIVQDYINWAKEHHIVVWPWRWSCAWSLLSFVIGITDIDPLEYDLIFERFLNPWRISMPDIDTDFEDTLRDQVIEYIRDKYWEENVAHIGTYMTMAAKAAFKDVARVYGIKFEQSNKLSTLISEKTIPKSVQENKELQEAIASDGRIKKIIDIATALEWTVRQTWVHACWMIIAPEATINYSAIQYPPKSWSKWSRDESRIVSQYEWPTIENIWLLKMDILWLRNLSIIKHTIRILSAQAKAANKELNPLFQEFLDTMLFHPPLDDEFTYKKIFHKWDTSWVFQFESDGMKQWLKKLKPTDFNDLIAMVSLYRPWPMDFIPHYIDRKHGNEVVTYMDNEIYNELIQIYGQEVADEEKRKLKEDLEPFMWITYGIAVYQEQLMRLVQAMAWFSMSEADKLRKWVGKKIREVIEKVKKEFVQKAQSYKWYKPETVIWVYEKMVEPAADYSFNKSHAACYAYISYQTAWLKAHYPIEFHAALLRSVEEDTDKLAKFADEVKLQWYTIELPNVNKSFEHVAAVDGKIYLWFRSIKWIWSDIAEFIEHERKNNWPYKSLPDFLKRCEANMNKKSVVSLVKSWALDQFYDRFTLLANTWRMLDWVKSSSSQQATAWLFAMEAVEGADLVLDKVAPWSFMELLKTEFDIFKSLISAHPLDGMYPFARSKYNFISMFVDKENYWEFSLLWYIKSVSRWMRWWFFLKIEDISWEIEIYVNEKLDLKPFDIIGIQWWKWRSPRIEKMVIFTYEELLEKVQSKGQYKPEMTVASVRKERMLKAAPPSKEPYKSSVKDESKTETKQNIHHEIPIEKVPETSTHEPKTSFKIPETMDLMMQVSSLVKSHPWTIEITIWDNKTALSQEGVDKLRTLYT